MIAPLTSGLQRLGPRPFSSRLNLQTDAPLPPDDLIAAAQAAAQTVATPEEAEQAFADFAAKLAVYAPDSKLFIACAMLLEKQRFHDGMLSAWADLQSLFPTEPNVVRMLMRWYRRCRQTEEGLQRLHQIVPTVTDDPALADLRLTGYLELNAHAEVDRMMVEALASFPDERILRIRYVQALMKQQRYLEAVRIARQLGDPERLGPAAQALVEEAENQARTLDLAAVEDVSDVLGQMVARFKARQPRPLSQGGIGPTVFFTGQLGAGGAERQMTRLAAAMQDAWSGNRPIGPHRLLAPPRVCVRHTTPSTGADFFLPTLQGAGVETMVLADTAALDADPLHDQPADLRRMLSLLPEDLQANTLKLVPYFRQNRIEIAYLWQDGGVLTAALAALIADVPRIVTSFRGLPPNLRPELLRPQMPLLYRMLATVPGVSFTANSQSTATAYESWLELPAGTIQVVHNAVPDLDASGDEDDQALWSEIEAASPGCTRTVLGIFRFDHNKRPDLWVRIAIDHARSRADTRYVILGAGVEQNRCRRLIDAVGLQDRIFLPGPTRHVGFFLHRADLLMHLARYEGLPNVLIEAQLAGRPVLATPAGGTAEILRHGETGLVLPDTHNPDPAGILQALDFLLADRRRLSRMGAAATRHSQSRFLVDRILAATFSIFTAEGQKDLRECELS